MGGCGVGLAAFLLWTLLFCKTQNLSCSHYSLYVLLELKPAMQTGLHPLGIMQLWGSESPSSCSSSFSLRVWGMLPDHSRLLCRGSCVCMELPSSCLHVLFSEKESGSSPGPMCCAALGHCIPKAGVPPGIPQHGTLPPECVLPTMWGLSPRWSWHLPVPSWVLPLVLRPS